MWRALGLLVGVVIVAVDHRGAGGVQHLRKSMDAKARKLDRGVVNDQQRMRAGGVGENQLDRAAAGDSIDLKRLTPGDVGFAGDGEQEDLIDHARAAKMLDRRAGKFVSAVWDECVNWCLCHRSSC